jgi:hypothetical protein
MDRTVNAVRQGRVCCVVVVVVEDAIGGGADVVRSVVVLVTWSELPQPATSRVLVNNAATVSNRKPRGVLVMA